MRFLPLLTALAGLLTTSVGQLVTTNNGLVQGTPSNVAGQVINQFLGIPYAKPPIGPLRFKRTQPAVNWSSTLQADTWAPQCWQASDNGLNLMSYPYIKNRTYSEDCLFLNVWAPSGAVKKPVMIFIHGGALITGTASNDVYNGEMLAAKADAVVVTMNYRLGFFGFLYADGDKENYPGNQALYDQLEAMKWVKANIINFGGDPDQVTIVGESAGSWAVSAHIISPLSQPYFKQAVMQSGSGISNWAVAKPQTYVPEVLLGMRIYGCGRGSNTIDATVMACLNALPSYDVVYIFDRIYRHPFNQLYPLIISPSEFLPKSYKEAFNSRAYKDDINLLISTVENEGPLFTASMPGGRYDYLAPQPLTRFNAIEDAKAWAKVNTGSEQGDFIPDNYFPTSLTAENDLRKRVAEMAGDEALVCPTIAFGERVYTASFLLRAKVYQLHFTSKSGFNKMWCTPWAAPCHGDDLFPTFGYALRYPSSVLTARETEIANEYMDMFKSFLKDGRPAPLTAILSHPWKPYTLAIPRNYYEISDEPRSLLTSYKAHLKSAKCLRWDQENSLI